MVKTPKVEKMNFFTPTNRPSSPCRSQSLDTTLPHSGSHWTQSLHHKHRNRYGSSNSDDTSNSSGSVQSSGLVSSSASNTSINKPATSSIATIVSKAKRHGLKRFPTMIDLRGLQDELKHQLPMMRAPVVDCTPPHDERDCYFLTYNEEEIDRVQRKNDLMKLAFEREFTLPVPYETIRGGRVLDIGCGPGNWCLDFAKQFPEIHVIGVDCMNAILPSSSPSNCEFRRMDVLNNNNLVNNFTLESIDMIHIRFMCLSFTKKQYIRVIQEAWKLLKPGGYLEIIEMDMLIYSPGPLTEKLNHDVFEAARMRGLRPQIAKELQNLLPEGTVEKSEKYRSLPIGYWGGRLGAMFREDIFHLFKHSYQAVNGYMAEKHQDDFELQLNAVLREFEKYHSFSNFHFVVGRKPPTPVPS